jgi:hypothetical protein
MWETELAAPTPASELFTGGPRISGLDHAFLDKDSLDRTLGGKHENLPRYLHLDPLRNVMTLAGDDKGEQVFMSELTERLHEHRRMATLVIIAGGLFTITPHDPSAFARYRRNFYEALPWHQAIQERVSVALPNAEYSALHVRMTDRSHEAPTRHAIRRALELMKQRGLPGSLFLAADTSQGREEWAGSATRMGFTPWSQTGIDLSRSAPANGIGAAVDWILLSRSAFLAYPGASTFSAEACIANGGHGIAMHASSPTRMFRAGREVLYNAVTYPQRHGWISGKR